MLKVPALQFLIVIVPSHGSMHGLAAVFASLPGCWLLLHTLFPRSFFSRCGALCCSTVFLKALQGYLLFQEARQGSFSRPCTL